MKLFEIVAHEIKRLILETQQRLIEMELPHGYGIIVTKAETKNPHHQARGSAVCVGAITFRYTQDDATLPSEGGSLSMYSDRVIMVLPEISMSNKVIITWNLNDAISQLQEWLAENIEDSIGRGNSDDD